jgi:hypothetical protein
VEGETSLYGQDERGWVIMEVSNDTLKLLIARDSIRLGHMPWIQVVERIAMHFDLQPDQKLLFQSILMTTDDQQIEDALERADLMPDIEYTNDATSSVADDFPSEIVDSSGDAPGSRTSQASDSTLISSQVTQDQGALPHDDRFSTPGYSSRRTSSSSSCRTRMTTDMRKVSLRS